MEAYRFCLLMVRMKKQRCPRTVHLSCLLLLFLAGASSGNAEVAYTVRTFTTDHGLPQNTVHAIQQTRDGYLWIATRFGLARFDGVRFVTFTPVNTPAFPNVNCTALAESDDGVLWIGTKKGLVTMRSGKFRRIGGEMNARHVWTLLMGGQGEVWAGTDAGLFRLEGETIEKVSSPTGAPAHAGGKPAKGIDALFQAYQKAASSCGQDTAGLTREKLAGVVKRQQTALKEKLGCERVSFRVTVEDGRVRVKATPK